MRHYIHYGYPIAIYNCEKKELVGLFKVKTFAARYLYNGNGGRNVLKIVNALNRRSRIKDTSFDFPIVVRACTQEQKELLSEGDFTILNGYPEPTHWQMKGFDSESLIIFRLKNIKDAII